MALARFVHSPSTKLHLRRPSSLELSVPHPGRARGPSMKTQVLKGLAWLLWLGVPPPTRRAIVGVGRSIQRAVTVKATAPKHGYRLGHSCEVQSRVVRTREVLLLFGKDDLKHAELRELSRSSVDYKTSCRLLIRPSHLN